MISRRSVMMSGFAVPMFGVNAPAAPMTLESAVTELERGRVVMLGTPSARAQTGEPYVIIRHGMVLAGEGEFAEAAISEAEAVAQWFSLAMRYAAGRPGILYWRTRPEVESHRVIGQPARWTVYSRLLISDKATTRNRVEV